MSLFQQSLQLHSMQRLGGAQLNLSPSKDNSTMTDDCFDLIFKKKTVQPRNDEKSMAKPGQKLYLNTRSGL